MRRRAQPLLLLKALHALSWAAIVGLLATPAGAHHSASSSPSEGLRTLTALGADATPRQRAALLLEVGRSSADTTLNGQTGALLSALIDFRASQRLFLGASVPFVVAKEELSDSTKAGLGDLRLAAQLSLGQPGPEQTARWSLALALSLPTRTIRYELDPGSQWVVVPGVRYADQFGKLLWYAWMLSPLEMRPAGAAIDLSPAAGVGYQILPPLALTLGLNADIRMLNICTDGPDRGYCSEGRISEKNRHVGATRLYATTSGTVDIGRNWSVLASAQLPLTTLRDVEWFLSAGIEARF